MGLPFGAKAKPSAFAEKGALRFDLGMWNGSRFEPFDPEIIFPLDVQLSGFEYPKDVPLGWRNIYAHYTPVTRRIDRIEVHDYFAVSRAPDSTIRELAFGRLASAIAEAYPAESVETACRYVRYAEQYLVVTSISSRALAAAGRAEAEAIGRLTGGGRLV
jgi:hypothetical protein